MSHVFEISSRIHETNLPLLHKVYKAILLMSSRKHEISLNVRTPSWIDVEAIAKNYNLDKDRLKIVLHQFFLSFIMNKRIAKMNKVQRYPEGYFPVYSELLKKICTNSYVSYINAMLETGVIEKKKSKFGVRSYRVGHHSQLYKWSGADVSETTLAFTKSKVTSYKQVKSVLATRDFHMKENGKRNHYYSKLEPLHYKLLEYLNDIEFDKEFKEKLEMNNTSGDLNFLTAEAYNNRDRFWFKLDNFGRRLHHPIAVIPKIYRNRLRFKGNDSPLAILDIKNSQPYFSSVFMKYGFIEQYLPEFKPLLPLVHNYENKKDFELYRELCINGQLYEFMMEARGIKIQDNQEFDEVRKETKELLFSGVLYSKLRVYAKNKAFKDIFKREFPNVHELFSKIKRIDETILPELKDIIKPSDINFKSPKSNFGYKNVPCLMQRAESTMMYDVISPRLISANIKFVTIHDSILVLPEYLEQAHRIFTGSFSYVGLPVPQLSKE